MEQRALCLCLGKHKASLLDNKDEKCSLQNYSVDLILVNVKGMTEVTESVLDIDIVRLTVKISHFVFAVNGRQSVMLEREKVNDQGCY